jgi:hypothetical protein
MNAVEKALQGRIEALEKENAKMWQIIAHILTTTREIIITETPYKGIENYTGELERLNKNYNLCLDGIAEYERKAKLEGEERT